MNENGHKKQKPMRIKEMKVESRKEKRCLPRRNDTIQDAYIDLPASLFNASPRRWSLTVARASPRTSYGVVVFIYVLRYTWRP